MFDDVVRLLDARRLRLGITKAELARRADMPAAVVRRLFSQQHKNPTLTTLVALADSLGLKLTLGSSEMRTEPLSHTPEDSQSGGYNVIPGPSDVYGTRRHPA
ncbi:MAG: helix-turn-helix domain-containing protein [Acidimicrobiales bacterium]